MSWQLFQFTEFLLALRKDLIEPEETFHSNIGHNT